MLLMAAPLAAPLLTCAWLSAPSSAPKATLRAEMAWPPRWSRAYPPTWEARRSMASVVSSAGALTPYALAQAQLAREKTRSRKRLRLEQLARLSLLSALLGPCVVVAGPPRPLLAKTVLGALLCTLPALVNNGRAGSSGFGVAFVWQAIIYAPYAASPGARLLVAAYCLYGLKLCFFKALRRTHSSVFSRALSTSSSAANEDVAPPWKGQLQRACGMTALLAAFSFPLHAAAAAPTAGVACGAVAAVGGLALQLLAELQKIRFQAEYGDRAVCRFGLWSFCRHPNLLGKIYFHSGLLIAGLAGAIASRSVGAALLCVLAPATLIGAILRTTRKIEAEQLLMYVDDVNYRSYVRSVPRLFVVELRIRAHLMRLFRSTADETQDSAIVDLWSGTPNSRLESKDEARAAIDQKEEEEELGSYIESIVGVTYLAGAVAAYLGYIGYLFAY
mmetsp:Transcript_23769/g.58993  ORF Transcript_23769/g.58993 Transcript_23769/m.58993 type:complete len:446 (-) Transcript_23769:223-1560(-)